MNRILDYLSRRRGQRTLFDLSYFLQFINYSLASIKCNGQRKMNSILFCLSGIFFPFHNVFAQVAPINLVRNGSFEYFDSLDYPLHWDLIDKYSYSKMFERTNVSKDGKFAIKMSRNCEGAHYMRQIVETKKNTIYQVSVAMSGIINDSAYGCIELFDLRNKILGKHCITLISIENYQKNLSVKFDSGLNEEVELRIGFSNGMNAVVYFDSVAFYEMPSWSSYSPQPCIKTLYDSLGLDLSREGFDLSVDKACGFINQMNISSLRSARKKFRKRQLKNLEVNRRGVLGKVYGCQKDNYVLESASVEANNLWIAYCQRTSLLSSKFLNYLNITTRQIHCHQNGLGFHQFFEYWNPYLEQWIIIDPYYGVKYSLNNRLMGIEEMLEYRKKERVNKKMLVKVDVHPFESSEENIVNVWTQEVLFQNGQDMRLSLP